jgi:hypothetical protein
VSIVTEGAGKKGGFIGFGEIGGDPESGTDNYPALQQLAGAMARPLRS